MAGAVCPKARHRECTSVCVCRAHVLHTARKCHSTSLLWHTWGLGQRASKTDTAASTWTLWDVTELQPPLISQSLHHTLPKKAVFPTLHFLTAQGAEPTETGQREDCSPSQAPESPWFLWFVISLPAAASVQSEWANVTRVSLSPRAFVLQK